MSGKLSNGPLFETPFAQAKVFDGPALAPGEDPLGAARGCITGVAIVLAAVLLGTAFVYAIFAILSAF